MDISELQNAADKARFYQSVETFEKAPGTLRQVNLTASMEEGTRIEMIVNPNDPEWKALEAVLGDVIARKKAEAGSELSTLGVNVAV